MLAVALFLTWSCPTFALRPAERAENPAGLEELAGAIASGLEEKVLHGHTGRVLSIAFNHQPGNPTMATASADGTIRIWNRESGNLLKVIRMWSREPGSKLRRFIQEAGVLQVAYRTIGRGIFAVGPHFAASWDASPGVRTIAQTSRLDFSQSLKLSARKSAPGRIALSPARTSMLAVPEGSREAWIVNLDQDRTDPATGQPLQVLARPAPGRGLPTAVAYRWFDPRRRWNRDGKVIAIGTDRGTVELWRIRNLRKDHLEKLLEFGGHSGAVLSLAFERAARGKKLASGDDRGEVRIWDARRPHQPRVLQHRERDPIYALAFSPGGKLLASGGKRGTVYLWDVESGDLVRKFVAERPSSVLSLEANPFSREIVAGYADGLVRIWDVEEAGLEEDSERVEDWLHDALIGQPVAGLDLTQTEAVLGRLARLRSGAGFSFITTLPVAWDKNEHPWVFSPRKVWIPKGALRSSVRYFNQVLLPAIQRRAGTELGSAVRRRRAPDRLEWILAPFTSRAVLAWLSVLYAEEGEPLAMDATATFAVQRKVRAGQEMFEIRRSFREFPPIPSERPIGWKGPVSPALLRNSARRLSLAVRDQGFDAGVMAYGREVWSNGKTADVDLRDLLGMVFGDLDAPAATLKRLYERSPRLRARLLLLELIPHLVQQAWEDSGNAEPSAIANAAAGMLTIHLDNPALEPLLREDLEHLSQRVLEFLLGSQATAGLEEKFDTFEKFQKWHDQHHVKVAADAAQTGYHGDALWHLWRAIEATLRQKIKESAAAWAGKHTADLTKLLEQDLNRLIEAYRAHYAEARWNLRVVKPGDPLPPGVELWFDPFGSPLAEKQVSALEGAGRIFRVLHLTPGQTGTKEKPTGIVFETPASLLQRAEASWNILGTSSRTADGPSRTKHLHVLNAKVFGGSEAQRALQPLRSRELTQSGLQPSAGSRSDADKAIIPPALPLKDHLIYPNPENDPFLNHLRFVRRRLANLPKRDAFAPEEVLTLLVKHYTQVDDKGKPMETEAQARERIQRVLDAARKITPKEPFASKGDAETLVDELRFAVGLAPYKDLDPIPAARDLIKRVERNEPAGGRLASAILWLVEELRKPKGERDRAKLTDAVWTKFGGQAAAPPKPGKGPPEKRPPGTGSSADIQLPPPPKAAGLEEKPSPQKPVFNSLAEFEAARQKVVKAAKDSLEIEQYGDAIWARWLAIASILNQVLKQPNKPVAAWVPGSREKLLELLQEDLAALAAYLKTHFGNHGPAKLLDSFDKLGDQPPAGLATIDLFGREVSWNQVKALAQQGKIFRGVRFQSRAKEVRPEQGLIVLETASHLLAMAELGRPPPRAAEMGKFLHLAGAKVDSVSQAYRYMQEARIAEEQKKLEETKRGGPALADAGQGEAAARAPRVTTEDPLRTSLIYPYPQVERLDKSLNDLPFIRYRWAHLADREEVFDAAVTLLSRIFMVTQQAMQKELGKGRQIGPKRPLLDQKDAEAVVNEVIHFRENYPKEPEAQKKILERIRQGEPADGLMAKVVQWVLKRLDNDQRDKKPTDRFQLAEDLWVALNSPPPAAPQAGLEEGLSLAQIYRRMRPLVMRPEHRVLALDVNGVLTPGEPAMVQEMVLDRLDEWMRRRITVITLSREKHESKGAALQQWLQARGIAPAASLFVDDGLENFEGFPGLAGWGGTAVYLGAYAPDLPPNVIQFGLAGDEKPQEGERIARLILALEMAKRELPRDLLATARTAVLNDDWIGFREPVEFLLDRMHLAPTEPIPDRPALMERTARELSPGIFLVPGSVLNGIFSISPYGSVSAMTNLPPWARPDQPGMTPDEAWNKLIRWDPDLRWLHDAQRAELLRRLMTLNHTLITPAVAASASELRYVLEHERFHGLIFSKPGQPKLLEDGFADLKAANHVLVRLFEANSSAKTWEEFWPSWFRVPVDDPEKRRIWNLAAGSVVERIRDGAFSDGVALAVDLADRLGDQAVAEVEAILPQVHASLGLRPPATAGLEEEWIFGPLASDELPGFIMDTMHTLAIQPQAGDLQEIALQGSMPENLMLFRADAGHAAVRSPDFEELRAEVVQTLRDGGVRFRNGEQWVVIYLGPTKIRSERMDEDEEEPATEASGFGIALTPFDQQALQTEVPEPAQWETSGEGLTVYLGRLISTYATLGGANAIRIVLPDGREGTHLIPPVQYQQAVYNLLRELAGSLGDLAHEIAYEVVQEREISVDPATGLRTITLTLDDGEVHEDWGTDAAGLEEGWWIVGPLASNRLADLILDFHHDRARAEPMTEEPLILSVPLPEAVLTFAADRGHASVRSPDFEETRADVVGTLREGGVRFRKDERWVATFLGPMELELGKLEDANQVLGRVEGYGIALSPYDPEALEQEVPEPWAWGQRGEEMAIYLNRLVSLYHTLGGTTVLEIQKADGDILVGELLGDADPGRVNEVLQRFLDFLGESGKEIARDVVARGEVFRDARGDFRTVVLQLVAPGSEGWDAAGLEEGLGGNLQALAQHLGSQWTHWPSAYREMVDYYNAATQGMLRRGLILQVQEFQGTDLGKPVGWSALKELLGSVLPVPYRLPEPEKLPTGNWIEMNTGKDQLKIQWETRKETLPIHFGNGDLFQIQVLTRDGPRKLIPFLEEVIGKKLQPTSIHQPGVPPERMWIPEAGGQLVGTWRGALRFVYNMPYSRILLDEAGHLFTYSVSNASFSSQQKEQPPSIPWWSMVVLDTHSHPPTTTVESDEGWIASSGRSIGDVRSAVEPLPLKRLRKFGYQPEDPATLYHASAVPTMVFVRKGDQMVGDGMAFELETGLLGLEIKQKTRTLLVKPFVVQEAFRNLRAGPSTLLPAGLEEGSRKPAARFPEFQRYEDFDSAHERIMEFAGSVFEHQYHGEAIWAGWTALLVGLSQAGPLFSRRADLQARIESDLEKLADYYYQAYFQKGVGDAEVVPAARISTTIEDLGAGGSTIHWMDVYGSPIPWDEVRSLAEQRVLAWVVFSGGKEQKSGVAIENAAFLMEKALRKEPLPTIPQLGKNLFLLGARVFQGQGGKALKHVEAGRKAVEQEAARTQAIAQHGSAQPGDLQSQLIYPSSDADPNANHSSFIQRRLASLLRSGSFPNDAEMPTRPLVRPLKTTHQAAGELLKKARLITPEQPFPAEGDAQALVEEVKFFLETYANPGLDADGATLQILERIDRNEDPAGKFAQAVRWLVDHLSSSGTEKDPVVLTQSVLQSFGGLATPPAPLPPTQAGLEEVPSVREVLLVGRRWTLPPEEWSSVAGKQGIQMITATDLAQAREKLEGMHRRSLFEVSYGVVIHDNVALASEVKAFIQDELNPDVRRPSETVPVELLFSRVPEGPGLAEIDALRERGQISGYGGGGDGTNWSEAGVEGILREMSQVVQKDLQLAREFRPKIDLEAGPSTELGEGILPNHPQVVQWVSRTLFWVIGQEADLLFLRFERHESDERAYLVGDLLVGPPGQEKFRQLRGGEIRVETDLESYRSVIQHLKNLAGIFQQAPGEDRRLQGVISMNVEGKPLKIHLTVVHPEGSSEMADLRLEFPEGRPAEVAGPSTLLEAGLEEKGAVRVATVEDLAAVDPGLPARLGLEGKAGIALVPVNAAPVARQRNIQLYGHQTVFDAAFYLLPSEWGLDGWEVLPRENIAGANQLLQEATKRVERGGVVIALDAKALEGLMLPEGHPLTLLLNADPERWNSINPGLLSVFVEGLLERRNVVLDLTAGSIRVVEIPGWGQFFAIDLAHSA